MILFHGCLLCTDPRLNDNVMVFADSTAAKDYGQFWTPIRQIPPRVPIKLADEQGPAVLEEFFENRCRFFVHHLKPRFAYVCDAERIWLEEEIAAGRLNAVDVEKQNEGISPAIRAGLFRSDPAVQEILTSAI